VTERVLIAVFLPETEHGDFSQQPIQVVFVALPAVVKAVGKAVGKAVVKAVVVKHSCDVLLREAGSNSWHDTTFSPPSLYPI